MSQNSQPQQQQQQQTSNPQIGSPINGMPKTPSSSSNPPTLASNINHACSLISSCSLSSSLSSSSTASSASTCSSTPQTANANTTSLVAPLATISELNNSCSHDISRTKSGQKGMDHYSTLPSSLNTLKDVSGAACNHDNVNTAGNDNKYRSLNKLTNSSNTSSNTMVDECINDAMTMQESGNGVNNNNNVNGSKTATQAAPVSFSQNLDIFKMNKKNKKGKNFNIINKEIVFLECLRVNK